jgi:hypothetical protein
MGAASADERQSQVECLLATELAQESNVGVRRALLDLAGIIAGSRTSRAHRLVRDRLSELKKNGDEQQEAIAAELLDD